jgi:methyl-accepting chemotaxis protein
MSALIENAKISSKVVGVIALLAIVMVVTIAFASFGMGRISSTYSDLAERVEPAVALNIRMSRDIAEYAHKAYGLAMEDTDEGNRRVIAEVAAERKNIGDLSEQVHKALPEYQSQLTEVDTLMASAYQICAGPIKDAGETSLPAEIVKAGHRLRDECDPALTKALDTITKINTELMALTKTKSIELSASAGKTIWVTIAVAVAGLVVAVAAGLWVASKGITQPIQLLSGVMERFARNELEADVPGTARGDELGAMARTVQVFKQNALDRQAMEAREREEIASREKRAQSISSLTQDFDAKAADLLGIITHAAGALKDTAQSMSATAKQTTHQALEVSSAADQASANVQTVATAAEELSASILEISRQVDQSASVAAAAASDAEQTNRTVQGLAESSARIGEVVSLINDIASQTNLLALNATIEAARAGDAGKGFAVVAGEVKTLATQTARATDEIGQQISAVQTATGQAVAAIGGIVKRIAEINMIAAAISSAVEEQSAATSEIARNIQEAATGTQRVSNNIGGVNQAAGETRAASDQVLTASESLISQSAYLESEVSKFLTGVRAA